MRRIPLLTLTAVMAAAAPAQAGVVDLTVPAARDTEPVVLSGKRLGTWSAPANQTVKLPLMDLAACKPTVDPSKAEDPREGGAEGLVKAVGKECPEGYDPHNHYAPPEVDTGDRLGKGTAVGALFGFRWDARRKRFRKIPFQVDERFTRYLDNSASGFALYSGQDQHTTYAFDREGFRYTADGPADNPCLAQPASPVATDPVAGLDHNDEIAFMAFDAGPAAPSGAALPKGIAELKPVELVDPTDKAARSYVYIGRAAGGAKAARSHAVDLEDGYVRYERDADADLYEFSQSSYSNYGNARKGVYCDKAGNVVHKDGKPDVQRRRPRDYATVTTDRYRFRYEGRWLMTEIRVKEHDADAYGPDLVDRWKARAFQQDAASETPCCGYEEEDTNWGGSSTLLGETVGPVRAIRETWGADSGTNVIRRETFYRDEVRQKTYLRVHPIPPLDGIYAQWDFNAGRVSTFVTPDKPKGVAIDGRNDEVFGNFDDPCNVNYESNERADFDRTYRWLYQQIQGCRFPYHQSVDMSDPTFNGANAALTWSVTAGEHGTIVDRYSAEAEDLTPGGAAQSVVAVPYYRDDACFDDGTGTDPGPKMKLRSADEPRTLPDGTARRCWALKDGLPRGDQRYFQGSIGTHGLHILFVAESDNARATVPLTEINAEHRMVMLPGDEAGAGERYGRGFEKPLIARVG